MCISILRCLSLLFYCAIICIPAFASEKILSFDSKIVVNADSSMDVTETIQVNVEGVDIKHGIYRDFPTRYKDRFGNNYVASYNVQRVLRDGAPENFFMRDLVNGKRAYIGKSDVLIDHAVHTYTIEYQAGREIGFFKDHDELYWNVTGNGWSFPIDHASASVSLPAGAVERVNAVDAYTGLQGARGKDFTTRTKGGQVLFETSRPFRVNEGLTVFVSWPKGFVQPLTDKMKFDLFLEDNKCLIVTLCALFAIFLYYIIAWAMFGRDIKKGTIIPLFALPECFSPAVVRYLMKMGFDDKDVSVAVINMAVKKHLSIEEHLSDGSTTYKLIKNPQGGNVALSPEEDAFFKSIFSSRQSIDLKQDNHTAISNAMDAVRDSLRKSIKDVYFVTNLAFSVCGIIFSFFAFIGALVIEVEPTVPSFLTLILGAVIINIVFYRLLKAPTLKGRKVMDQIEGFKMYLAAAEKDQLNIMNPPNKTPELFEKFLPFALALGVEQLWSQQFAKVMGDSYRPEWYLGRYHGLGLGYTSMATHLGDSLTTRISSSSIAPGSGGGSGGFSGGGGGGGGGGGW